MDSQTAEQQKAPTYRSLLGVCIEPWRKGVLARAHSHALDVQGSKAPWTESASKRINGTRNRGRLNWVAVNEVGLDCHLYILHIV